MGDPAGPAAVALARTGSLLVHGGASAVTYLDGALIERLRVERLLSVRALEAAIGVTGGWAQSVVAGANHETVPLRLALRLTDELGVHLTDMLVNKPDAGPLTEPAAETGPHLEADVRRLGAVLGDLPRQVRPTTLARELDWSAERLEFALGVLDRRLRGVEKKAVRGVAGVQIVRDTTDPDPAVALADQLREGGLNVTHVRVLAKVAHDEITRKAIATRSLGNAQEVAFGALIKAGFVQPPSGERHGTYGLADDVRLSLLLT